MKITPLNIPDVIVIEPDVFEDERGFFFEAFNQKKFNELLGQNITFVQDNHSKSKKAVLRGLHYQNKPYEQAKLVRVITGEIFDVAVDIRPNSSTYGNWVFQHLSSDNKKQLWIPKGLAHGFLCVSNEAEVLYKVDASYHKSSEIVINPFDKDLSIPWPRNDFFIQSVNDKNNIDFKDLVLV